MRKPPTKEETRWLKRLEKVLADMPESMWLFYDGGSQRLMPMRLEKGERVVERNGSFGNVIDYQIEQPPKIDGGAF